jgi:hypothetical protein
MEGSMGWPCSTHESNEKFIFFWKPKELDHFEDLDFFKDGVKKDLQENV